MMVIMMMCSAALETVCLNCRGAEPAGLLGGPSSRDARLFPLGKAVPVTCRFGMG